MLASIRHGIMLWGPDRRLIATNHVAAELLGHPPGSLVPGKSQADLVDEMLARGAFGTGASAATRAARLKERDWASTLCPAIHHARGASAGGAFAADTGWRGRLDIHRHHRGTQRGDRIAPRQAGGGGRQPGEVALPGDHEPRIAHAAERGDRLLRSAAARGGAPIAPAGRRVCPARSTTPDGSCSI